MGYSSSLTDKEWEIIEPFKKAWDLVAQPFYGDEIRSLRKLQRDYPASPYVFQFKHPRYDYR
ncbi:MAG: hypothetical protein AAFY76_17245 [Cyanobacteria bacterium J06649_11]